MRKQRRRSAVQSCTADKPLCFRYSDSTIPLLLNVNIFIQIYNIQIQEQIQMTSDGGNGSYNV